MVGNKPRWEVKYEKILSEEPIKEKIEKIEKSIKDKIKRREVKIAKLEGKKVTGDFKTKEEYESAVEKHNNQIQDIKNEKQELENYLVNDQKLHEYKSYEKNKDKIKNIYEYRKELESKLKKLPKNVKQEIDNKKKEQEVKGILIEQYQNEIYSLKNELSNKNMSDEERQIRLLTLRKKLDNLGSLQAEQTSIDFELAELEKNNNYDSKIDNKREEYLRKISKCNLIAANLLKGKNLDDIKIKVEEEGKKFTSLDGKLGEIINAVKGKNIEKTRIPEKIGTAITTVSEFSQKHPRLAKIGNFFKNLFTKKEKDTGHIEDKDILSSVKINSDENDMLIKITEKGRKEAFREKYAVNKQIAANKYAEKYGGTYERQDGATTKRKEKDRDINK